MSSERHLHKSWHTGCRERSSHTRNITDPRALALVLEQAEAKLAKEAHPDPYRRELSPSSFQRRARSDGLVAPMFPDGTKWYVSLLMFRTMFELTKCLGSVTFL